MPALDPAIQKTAGICDSEQKITYTLIIEGTHEKDIKYFLVLLVIFTTASPKYFPVTNWLTRISMIL